jgi:hypothetical protein
LSALGGSTERLFEDRGEAARLVARRRVVVHLAAVLRGVFLPPADAGDELLADLTGRGTPREKMLGAVDLRRLREDRGAAVAHEEIGGRTQRRIGGEGRMPVRAAALQRQRDLRGRTRFALGPRGERDHVANGGGDCLHGLARAAGLLNRQGPEGVGFLQPVFLLHAADLEHLAAQTHHHDAGEVRVARIAPLGAAQNLEALAIGRVPAARAVHDGDDAVDAGIVLEDSGALHFRGREARHRRRAVHRGEDAEIVARAGFAGVAAIALEGGLKLRRQEIVVAGVLGKAVIALEFVQAHIVLVDPFAGRDVGFGEADDLAEFLDRLTLADRRHGHLVAAQNALAGGETRGRIALLDDIDGNGDVIVRMEADGAGRGLNGRVHNSRAF